MMNKKVKLQSEFKIFPDISYQHYHKKTIFIYLYTSTGNPSSNPTLYSTLI